MGLAQITLQLLTLRQRQAEHAAYLRALTGTGRGNSPDRPVFIANTSMPRRRFGPPGSRGNPIPIRRIGRR